MAATLAIPAQAPERGPAQETIGEMAWLLRDTRGGIVLGGSVLSAITIGAGTEAALVSPALRHGPAGLAGAVLLAVLALCWLRAAALLLLAGRPVLDQLSAHRWRTGAPVDPRVRWLTVPPAGPGAAAWDWASVNLLLGV